MMGVNAAMNLSAQGARLIQWEEDSHGPKLVAFKPTPNDVWTIGWGHTHGVTQGMTCTAEQAQAWFTGDVAWAVQAVRDQTTYPLTQTKFDALCDFTFNEGAANLHTSTLLHLVNAGNLDAAANEFDKWIYQRDAKGVLHVLNGLVARRAVEKQLWLNGIYPV